MRTLIYILLITGFSSINLNAQNNAKKPSVFIDCDECQFDHIRRNIEFVNYVRDPKQADIHVLITDQRTGGGGEMFIFHFIGRKEYYEIEFELSRSVTQTKTAIEVQDEIVSVLKSGLIPYVSHVNKNVRVDVFVPGVKETMQDISQNDPWNNWIFEISGNFGYEKERSRTEYEVEGELEIERVTEDWRIRSEIEYEYEENQFQRDESEIISNLNRSGFEVSVVRSLGEHWSGGVFGRINTSTFNNIDVSTRLNAAIEYNFYPYSISNRKEFSVAYFIGPRYNKYNEETIFGKKEEQLMAESLQFRYDIQQPWGNIFAVLEGFHYFHDFNKNSLQLDSYLSIRILEGLSFRLGNEIEIIHDQIYLPKGDATLEEVLLERKALATNFNFEFNVGLAYTFGSIYNNVVNTRL